MLASDDGSELSMIRRRDGIFDSRHGSWKARSSRAQQEADASRDGEAIAPGSLPKARLDPREAVDEAVAMAISTSSTTSS